MISTKKLTTIEQYFNLYPNDVRENLELIRQTIRKAVPKAEELISYSMPAFKLHGMLAYYAVAKSHYWLYISPWVLDLFREELSKKYIIAKATIQFPFGKPIPTALITKLVKKVAQVNLEREEKKAAVKKMK